MSALADMRTQLHASLVLNRARMLDADLIRSPRKDKRV